MSNKSLKYFFIMCLGIFLNSGCITLYSKTKVINSSEERLNIEFENDRASDLFIKAYKRTSLKSEKTRIGIPFVSFYTKTVVESGNAHFNKEIKKCDLNGDNKILEIEARSYYRMNTDSFDRFEDNMDDDFEEKK